MANFSAQAKLFKALSHPARLAILEALRPGEQRVGDLAAALGFRQAYLSQHLMVLRSAGVVCDRREGWNVFYRLARPDLVRALEDFHACVESSESKGKVNNATHQ